MPGLSFILLADRLLAQVATVPAMRCRAAMCCHVADMTHRLLQSSPAHAAECIPFSCISRLLVSHVYFFGLDITVPYASTLAERGRSRRGGLS